VADNPDLKNNPAVESLRKTLLKEPLAFFRSLRAIRSGNLLEKSGKPIDAMKAYESAVEILENLIKASPANLNDLLNYQTDLAGVYMNIGIHQKKAGQPDEALKSYGKALPIWQKLARDFPDVVAVQSNLGGIYQNIGTLQAGTGKPAEAMKSFDLALAIWRKLTDVHRTVTEFQNNLASTYMLIAMLQQGTEALPSQERAAAIWKKLIDAHPTVTAFRYNLAGVLSNMAGTQHNMAQTMKSQGDKAGAMALFQKARSNSEAVVRADGANMHAQVNLSNHHQAIGKLLLEAGKRAESLESYAQALTIQRKLADLHPADPGFLNTLADCHINVAILKKELRKPAEAMVSYEEARAIRERLLREHPESADFACRLAGALSDMADLDLNAQRFAEARVRLRWAIALQKKALATVPKHPTCRAFLTIHLDLLIKADKELGRAEEAAEAQRALQDLKAGDQGMATLDARLSKLLKPDAP
jgi:tetratricopeptide (TPR) repeat protein